MHRTATGLNPHQWKAGEISCKTSAFTITGQNVIRCVQPSHDCHVDSSKDCSMSVVLLKSHFRSYKKRLTRNAQSDNIQKTHHYVTVPWFSSIWFCSVISTACFVRCLFYSRLAYSICGPFHATAFAVKGAPVTAELVSCFQKSFYGKNLRFLQLFPSLKLGTYQKLGGNLFMGNNFPFGKCYPQ